MPRKTSRDDELSTRKKIREKFLKVLEDVEKGVTDEQERTDKIKDAWDAYDCVYSGKQFYNGNSQVFISLITDAVDARQTRFTNQIFPQSSRCVEVISENEDIPAAISALLEHYVRRMKLRTEIVPSLLVNGDIEGQYTLYTSWEKTKRNIVKRVKRYPEVDGIEQIDLEPVDDVEEETIEEGCPHVEVLSDSDVLFLPATAKSVEDCVMQGGSVTIIRRWRKAKIKQLISDGEIVKDEGEDLLKAMDKPGTDAENKDTAKRLAGHAGIKAKGDYTVVHEVWTRLEVDGEWRLCRGYGAGDKRVLGIKLCPYWDDQVPVITAAVKKKAGSLKGVAPVSKVLDIQYAANDVLNEALDTGHFSAMPIIMTDPEKNPRVSSMVLGLASVWETSPKDTSFAQFPDMWRTMMERIGAMKDQLFQSLGVNPSMMPYTSGRPGAKRNQAEIAQEQQVDILTTADMVTTIEEGILTPLLQRIAAYDHQFRDEPLMIRQYGPMGQRAVMQDVEPIQMDRRYEFRWFGVEAARSVAQIQQQISILNVAKGIPPQLYQGYRLDLAPIMSQIIENALGPRLAPLTFVSIKDDMTMDPEIENEMLEHGFEVHTHAGDDDQAHIASHMQALQMTGDPHGTIRAHLQMHQMQMAAKAQAQAAAQAQSPAGPPGGGGPQPGAAPGQPHAAKGPPGQIHPDRMAAAGAVTMPRKT